MALESRQNEIDTPLINLDAIQGSAKKACLGPLAYRGDKALDSYQVADPLQIVS
jgi:hypothetical protein